MRVLLKLLMGIVGLDAILVGMLVSAGAIVRRRARRRLTLVQLHGSERLRLVPPVSHRRPRSRRIDVALVTVVAVAGAAVGARSFHLITGNHETHVVAERQQLVPSSGVRDGRSARSTQVDTSTPTSVRVDPRPPVAGVRSESPPSNGTGGSRPASPSVVTAVPVSATKIKLAWTDVGSETRYLIERSPGGAAAWRTIATTDQDVTSYTDTELPPGTTYFYRVVAIAPDGASMPSDVASSTTITLPASPGLLTAVAGSSTAIDLSWGDVANETGFRIERSPDGVADWQAITTTGQGVTTYTDTQLSPDTTYSYRVFATDAGGDSPPSEVASATTAADTSSAATTP